MYDKNQINLKEYKFRREKAELVGASGKMSASPRRIVIFGAYIPPNTRAEQSRKALDLLAQAVEQAKSDFDQPIIIVGGDFNHRKLSDVVKEFSDMEEYDVPPTRSHAKLDRAASNIVPFVKKNLRDASTDNL